MTAAPPSKHAQADQLREAQLCCFRAALEAIAAGDPNCARIAQVALQTAYSLAALVTAHTDLIAEVAQFRAADTKEVP